MLLSLWLWLFNVYAKPGAGHTAMADLDLHRTGEETDRWTQDCCTLRCVVWGGKLGCCGRWLSELSGWAGYKNWSVLMGWEQEYNRRVAIPKQRKTKIHHRHLPEVSRKDSPFFQPAVSNALQFVAYQRWFSELLGRKGWQHWWAHFLFCFRPHPTPHTWVKRKINSNEKLSQGCHYCVFKHFLYA